MATEFAEALRAARVRLVPLQEEAARKAEGFKRPADKAVQLRLGADTLVAPLQAELSELTARRLRGECVDSEIATVKSQLAAATEKQKAMLEEAAEIEGALPFLRKDYEDAASDAQRAAAPIMDLRYRVFEALSQEMHVEHWQTAAREFVIAHLMVILAARHASQLRPDLPPLIPPESRAANLLLQKNLIFGQPRQGVLPWIEIGPTPDVVAEAESRMERILTELGIS